MDMIGCYMLFRLFQRTLVSGDDQFLTRFGERTFFMAQSKKAKPSADHQPGKKRNMNETTAR
jgi:hypothetical protein